MLDCWQIAKNGNKKETIKTSCFISAKVNNIYEKVTFAKKVFGKTIKHSLFLTKIILFSVFFFFQFCKIKPNDGHLESFFAVTEKRMSR
jgi:hypothetical protein